MAPEVSSSRVFVFGDCRLDTGRGSLHRNGHEVRLRPKSFEVLQYLLTHPGRLVSRRELLDNVWARRAVTDDSVTQCIVEIRRALSSVAGGPKLRTLPRRGYILDVVVEEVVAGLPLEPLASAPRVMARDRLRSWRGQAAALVAMAAFFVIAGSTWQASPSLATQTGQVTGKPTARNPALANQALLLGRHLFHRRQPGDLAAAEKQVQLALRLDPTDARAWTALAGIYAARDSEEHGDPTRRLQEQREALERALHLDPAHVEALVRLARVLRLAGDSTGAAAAVRSAMITAPDHPLVLCARAMRAAVRGRLDEAIEWQRQAVQANPLSAVYRNNLAQFLLGAGRHDEALAQLQHAQLLAPQAELAGTIARALVAVGRSSDAQAALPTVTDEALRDQLLAMTAPETSDANGALQRLEARGDSRSLLLLAEVAAFRGEMESAVEWLHGAIRQADNETPGAGELIDSDASVSPFLSGLRSDERWPWRDGRGTPAA